MISSDCIHLFKIEDRPYKNYDLIEYYIYRRDNFTCQNCGYTTSKKMYTTYGCCLLPNWFDSFALNNRHPTFCPILEEVGFKRLQVRNSTSRIDQLMIPHVKIPIYPCHECDYFAVYFFEDHEKGNLLVHHKNNNPCDNRLENLVTFCRSCNGLKQFKNL